MQHVSEEFPVAFSRFLFAAVYPLEVHPLSCDASVTQISEDTSTPLKQQQGSIFLVLTTLIAARLVLLLPMKQLGRSDQC